MKKAIYEFIDSVVIGLTAFSLGTIRYFGKSIESSDFETHIRNVTVTVPFIGEKGVYHISGETLAGKMETSVVVRLWKGLEYPTIFYQHGNVERIMNLFPYRENVFKRIFYPKALELPNYNLILIRSFMDGEILEHQRLMQQLDYYMARLAFYAALEEEMIQHFKSKVPKKSKAPITVVAGIGFGGTVANLHRSFFNTATAYAPMLAGADPSHVFTESSYRRLTGKLARNNRRELERRLNFENDFIRVMAHNVYPMLAVYDKVAVYRHQVRGFETKPVKIVSKGHYTTFADVRAIRSHLLDVVERATS